MARIYMRDFLTLDLRTADKKFFSCDSEAGGKSLLVRVAATHAGIVNGNLRFYRPDMMNRGTSTWVDGGDYPKPVLAHHNEDADPLGRVLSAKYMDLSYLYRDEYPILNDSIFYCSDSKKRMSMFETIDFIVDHLSKVPGYKGLGYTELGLKITQPDAIQKVLRKEFMTVSVGFATDSAICSICHQDWAVDDRCDHSLGQTYDSKLCYVISGSMDFHEVSYVNTPADPFAVTLDVQQLSDSLNRSFFLGLPIQDQNQRARAAGIALVDSLYSSDIEMLGDYKMKLDLKAIAEEIRIGVAQDRALAIRKDLGDFQGETDSEKKDAKRLLSSIRAKIKANGWDAAPKVDATQTGKTEESGFSQEEKDKLNAELAASENREEKPADAAASTEEVTDAANQIQLSDAVKKIFEGTNCKDANESVKKVASDLETTYSALDLSEKRYLRWALGSLISSWYDREEYESYMELLTIDRDMIVVPKTEHDELQSAIDSYAESEAKLIASRDAEETAKISILRKAKDTLASMIVMHKVITGAKGYVGLSQDQIQEQVSKRASRDLNSLLDARDEIFEDLQWVKPVEQEVAPKTISDSAKLPAEAAAEVTESAEEAKPEVENTDSVEEPEPAPRFFTNRREQLQYETQMRLKKLRAS